MKLLRLDEIEQFVLQRGTVTMPELCEHFDVSMNTIRRDILLLLARGTVQKVYGGVSARQSEQLTSFDARTVRRIQSKKNIAAAAAALIQENDTIYIDSGTTTMHIVQNLAHISHVTIITNNLQAINLSIANPAINIITLPGHLLRETNSFTGMETILALRKYHIRKAFMAATAISMTHGITNSSSLEYEIKRTAMQQSEKRYLLIDREKFNYTAMLTYAQPSDFTGIITDIEPPPEYIEAFLEANVELTVLPKPE